MNDNFAWILWTVLGVILVIAEVFTPGFVLLWFGIGALAAALAGLFGLGYPFQFLVFILVSIVLTAASRTIFSNYFVRKGDGGGIKMGIDALPGKIGIVVSSSRGPLEEGAVKVYGSTWTAYPSEGEAPLEAGDRVVVESLKGASIYVRRVDAVPEWRGQQALSAKREED